MTDIGLHDDRLQASAFRQSLNDIVAGTIGGVCTVLIGHPFDTIKVRMQTASTGSMSMVECIRMTLKEEGPRGFYKGMQSPLAGEGFFNAAQFFAYGHSKRFLLSRDVDSTTPLTTPTPSSTTTAASDLTVPQYFIAGAMTGFASTFIESPIDLFKTQLQSQVFRPVPLFTTFGGSVSYVFRTRGIRGCYQGLSGTFVRTTPASAFYFGIYEWTKKLQLKPGQKKEDLEPMNVLVAGGLGGMSYWISSYPLDCIKSSMQADAIEPSQRRYSSLVDCARKLYAEGGLARFYRGLTPCVIRSFPANAACFFAYEQALKIMEKI